MYIDRAKTGTTDKREAFQQMIQDSNARAFNILLVHKLDRFARNRYDSAVYKRELKKNGVIVYSVLENLDDSPESIMMEAMFDIPTRGDKHFIVTLDYARTQMEKSNLGRLQAAE